MFSSTEIWKLLAGVAIFLLGMSFMEESLQSLAGRKFKLFLKKQTSRKLKAIGGGAVVTGFLQSSSVVNLLVLSLVGAGVIQMQNALAVMLGSNLGTTFSSWIVATLGFTFDINSIALPVAGITGICLAFFTAASRWRQWNKFLFGFSFLFIGLGFIKEGMTGVVNHTDLSRFNHYPAFVFFLAGILLTAIIQSSSAVIALTLTALYTNAVSLYDATAIVLGSEIGTTLKLFIASVNGLAAKKRVALGNFLFNVITAIVMLLLLQPVNRLITDSMRVDNKLLALVFFQSFVNLAGIILFYPFLNVFGRFLEKRFASDDESWFISKVPVTETDLAVEALEKESRHFIFHVLSFITNVFDTTTTVSGDMLQKNFRRKPVSEQYDYIKRLHGEIHGFYTRLQNVSLSEAEVKRMGQLISCVRNCMYAAKSIRDAMADMQQFKNSSNDTKYDFYLLTRTKTDDFLKKVSGLLLQQNGAGCFEGITGIYRTIQEDYTKSLQDLYKEGIARHVNELEISTFINFNREMFTAFKSLVFTLKDYLLSPAEADYFDELPGFIR
jgi:phosphate:Na+ symporter